jgi:hypothetical protein
MWQRAIRRPEPVNDKFRNDMFKNPSFDERVLKIGEYL